MNTSRFHIIATVINDLTYDQRMIRICTALVEEGYQVTLVGRMKTNSVPLSDQTFQQKRLTSWFQKGKLKYIEYNIRLFFFLLFKKFDIVNAVDLDTISTGYLVSRLKRKKITYDAHEYFTELPEIVFRPKTRWIWTQVERLAVPRIKHSYTVCQSLADLYKKKYGVHFEVIRNVPFKRTIEKKDTNSQIILYQGALNVGRGLEQVIRAMKNIDNATLWLVGEGDLSEKLRTLTLENNLNDKVKFLGYVPPHELAFLTPQAYIGINLLQNQGLSYYYSLANKTFDYIQALVPAIHMDFPEYQNITKTHHVALLIPNLDIKTIETAIKQLLENESLYTELQQNCYRAREEYVWEKEKEKLLQVYSSVKQELLDTSSKKATI